MCVLHRIIARTFLTSPSLVHKELLLISLQYLVVGLSKFGVRKCVGEEAYEGMTGVLTVYPFQSLVMDNACRVLRTLKVVGTEHRILDVVLEHFTHHGCVASRS